MTQAEKQPRPWPMRKRSCVAKVQEGIIRTVGLRLPGEAFISLSSRASLFSDITSKDKVWGYHGFIAAPKFNRRNLSPKSPDYQIVSDIYAYLRQQWHVVSGLQDEKVRMSRSIYEARAVAKMLLQKGHCSQVQHDEIIELIMGLEAQFTDPDFRDEYKIRAGDLFMQVGVDPDPRAKKNAVHALTAYQGAARLEQRKHNALIMLHYLKPRFLQVRGVVQQLEDRTQQLAQALARHGHLSEVYSAHIQHASRRTRNYVIAQLGYFTDTIDLLTMVLPFAPQAGLAKLACDELREIIAKGRSVDDLYRDGLMDEMRFRVTLMRLIVRVERDIILPLTLLKEDGPRVEFDEQRRRIFAVTQTDIRLLLAKLRQESALSLSRLRDFEPWLAKFELCAQNKFEDHRIIRDDTKAFSRYLMLANTES